MGTRRKTLLHGCAESSSTVPSIAKVSFAYSYFGEDKILFDQRVHLMREFYGMIGLDILKLFRQMLSNGHYIQSCYNEESIPGKWAYQNSFYHHDFLLIGYDDVKKVFLSAGYLKDRKFQRYEIPYSNMLQSILSLKMERLWFSFWTYNPDVSFFLNLPRVISELSDYLNSTTSLSIYQGENLYGLVTIEALGDLFQKQGRARETDRF